MKISLYQAAIIMRNLQYLNKSPKYIDLGVERTVEQLIRELDVGIPISPTVLEELLYYVNILGEDGRFKHPNNAGHGSFILNCLPRNRTFDFKHNLIKPYRRTKNNERENTEQKTSFIPPIASDRDGD